MRNELEVTQQIEATAEAFWGNPLQKETLVSECGRHFPRVQERDVRRHIEAARLMLYNESVTCHVLLGNGRGPSIETLSFFAGKPGPSRGALAWRHPLGEHLALPLIRGILEQVGWGLFLRGAERILRKLVSPRVNQLYATVTLRHGPPMQPGSHTIACVRRCDIVAITRYEYDATELSFCPRSHLNSQQDNLRMASRGVGKVNRSSRVRPSPRLAAGLSL